MISTGLDCLLAIEPTWHELGWPGWIAGGVLLAVVFLLVAEVGTPDQVMLGGLVVLLLTGVVEPSAGLAGFSDPAVLTVGALFAVAAAVNHTGALAFLGWIMRPRSSRTVPALARVMLPASFLSGFLNNTPIVAFLTPPVQRWARAASLPASRLLIPLSYATILGGMCTVIGTSTNLVVSSQLEKHGLAGFSMFELSWVGVPAAGVGFLYFVLVGHRLLPRRADYTEEARGPGGRRSYQFDLSVPDDSPLVGRSIEKAGLRALQGAFLAHILRRGELFGPVAPSQLLEAGDILTFYGDTGVMHRLLDGGGLARPDALPERSAIEEPDGGEPRLPLYEAVVSAESSLVGRTLKDSDFRERFQAVVLGIHRLGRRVTGPVGLTPIEPGDLLLVEARPHFAQRWTHQGEFYLVASLERPGARATHRAGPVLAILVALMATVALDWLPVVVAAVGAAFAVVLTGALPIDRARRAVDLSVLLVIASAFGIGRAVQSTGLADCMAGTVVDVSAGMGLVGALAVVYLFTNIITEFLTNNVAAVLVVPVALAVGDRLGVDPRVFAVTVAIAASASFATPVGYQTNLLVMGPGGYRFGDYLRVGLPLNLLVFAVALAVVPRIWG